MGGGDQRTTLLARAPVNQARRWGDCGALCLAGAMPQDKRLQFGVTRVADDMESVTSHAVVSLLSQPVAAARITEPLSSRRNYRLQSYAARVVTSLRASRRYTIAEWARETIVFDRFCWRSSAAVR